MAFLVLRYLLVHFFCGFCQKLSTFFVRFAVRLDMIDHCRRAFAEVALEVIIRPGLHAR